MARSISRMIAVAQVRRRHQRAAVHRGPREAGEVVEEVGDVLGHVLAAGEDAEVGVEAGGGGVVVARPDVDVAAHPVALAPHDQAELGVRLQAREAVDDVGAGALQGARPLDVALLVEAGLHLDQADGLLALLGGAHERRDDRRVAAGAVDGLLDGEDVRVLDGLLHEALDAGVEVVVGVVHQDVAVADGREHVRALALLGPQARARARLPAARRAEPGRSISGERPERGEVERRRGCGRCRGSRPRAPPSGPRRGPRARRPPPRGARRGRSGAGAAGPRRRPSRSSDSSEIEKSASRVTRKRDGVERPACPGRAGRRAPRSRPRAAPAGRPTGRKRGSRGGTLMRAKRVSPFTGSRTRRPRFSDRPEM